MASSYTVKLFFPNLGLIPLIGPGILKLLRYLIKASSGEDEDKCEAESFDQSDSETEYMNEGECEYECSGHSQEKSNEDEQENCLSNEGEENMKDSFEMDCINQSLPHPHHHEHHPQHPPCPNHCPCGEQEYVLSEGHKVTIEKGKEVKHDIVLHHNPYKDCGTLSGIVKDKHGHPIENALVKVFDINHTPVTHVFTNHDGEFLICLEPGHYLVKAVR